MAFTTKSKASGGKTGVRLDRREKHRRVVEAARAKGRDLRRAMEEEGVEMDPATGLPVVGNPKRKAACERDLALFAKTYLPRVFALPMSEGQRADLGTMQRVCNEGGRYAFASPRGDGKTSRVEAAILWAALYGRRRCIVVVGADIGAASQIVDSVKAELRTNELLRQDFPLPCWAAALADDVALKAKGWTWGGVNLSMRWGKGGVTLPVLDGADGSGCVIVPRGLTGRLRGMRLKVAKRAVRPDLYAIDDPQTDESAASPSQVATRERLILGAIMGSGGPGASIAAFMPCTVIMHNDLAARFLDRKEHPDWQGSIRAMVTRWPDAQKTLWAEYAGLRREQGAEAGTAFYRQHRAEMDAGAVIDWPQRYERGKELSAIQHAQNLRIDLGEAVFSAEYQNTPIREGATTMYALTPDLIQKRTDDSMPPFKTPDWTQTIVAATDVNPSYGFTTTLVAFGGDQRAHVLWYGVESGEQFLSSKDDPPAVISRRVSEGLAAVGKQLAGCGVVPATWIIDGGGTPQDTVINFAAVSFRVCGLSALTAFGRNAKEYRPYGRHKITVREQCHLVSENINRRWLIWNADYWREIAQKGWTATPLLPGSCSLFAGHHREFAEQICREQLKGKADLGGGMRWEWVTQPGPHDAGDCMAMAYMGAAWSGIGTSGAVPVARVPQRRPIRVRHLEV